MVYTIEVCPTSNNPYTCTCDDIEGKCYEVEIKVVPLAELAEERERLAAKLDDMELHDDTGDPRDEGYMAAVNELREALAAADKEGEPDE